jgi:hypothetical protein
MAAENTTPLSGTLRVVSQICNLLYRSFANCRIFEVKGASNSNTTWPPHPCRLKIGGTAECNSAVLGGRFKERLIGSALILAALPLAAWGAAPVVAPTASAQLEGQALAVDLCALNPEQPVELTGRVTIKRRSQPALETPFRFKIMPGQPTWTSMYQTLAGDSNAPPQQLLIHRAAGKPNQYIVVTPRPGETSLSVTNTAGSAAAAFAQSDFLAGDLGLEFLRWRDQRLLRKEMTMSRACKVLESKPGPGEAAIGYGRVVSWVDNETGGILKAEAYDPAGKRLKEFELNSFKKVEGQYQLEEMEIRNVQTKSRTRLTFDLGK